jgi:hypothetical protein
MRRDDDTLAFMLARGRLSGAQRDRILNLVLRRRASRPRRWWLWVVGALTPMTAALALIVVAALRTTETRPQPAFAARGAADGPVVEARCLSRPKGICRRGDRLVFDVDGADRAAWLAAFAEGPSGARIWYFPGKRTPPPAVPAGGGHVVIGQAARIGDEHTVGRHRLHLLVLDQPADRAALESGQAPVVAETVVVLEVLP